MPYCPNCGKEIAEDVLFCPQCGQRLKQGFTPEERQKYIEELEASIEESQRIPEDRKRPTSAERITRQNRAAAGKPKPKLQSSLSKLPKVSDAFSNHIGGHPLQKNEWMPCPRCGESKVKPPAGVLAGTLGGLFGIGCVIPILVVVGIILGLIFWPLAAVVVIGGVIAIPLMPLIGAGLGMSYKCKSCGYSWTFAGVDKYNKSAD